MLPLLLHAAAEGPSVSHAKINVWQYPPPASSGISVTRVIYGNNGRIFAGTSKGLYELRLRQYHPVPGLPAQPVTSLLPLDGSRVGIQFATQSFVLAEDGSVSPASFPARPSLGSFSWGRNSVSITQLSPQTSPTGQFHLRLTLASQTLLETSFTLGKDSLSWSPVDHNRAFFRNGEYYLLFDAVSGSFRHLSFAVPSYPRDIFMSPTQPLMAIALGEDGIGLCNPALSGTRWSISSGPASIESFADSVQAYTASGIARLTPTPFPLPPGGIHRLNSTDDNRTFTIDPAPRDLQVDSMLVLPGPSTLLATRANGLLLASLPLGQLRRAPDPDSGLTNVRWLHTTPDGRIWAASKAGLAEIHHSPGSLPTRHAVPNHLGHTYISEFRLGPASSHWVIAEGLIARYTGSTWESYPLPSCLLTPKVRSLAIRSDREIWLSYRRSGPVTRLLAPPGKSYSQLASWQCTHFDASTGNPNFETNAVFADSRGWLWLSGDASTLVLPRSSPNPFLEAIHLPHRYFLSNGYGHWHGIAEADPQYIWLLVGNDVIRLPLALLEGMLRPPSPPRLNISTTGAAEILAGSFWPPGLDYSLSWTAHTSAGLPLGLPTKQPSFLISALPGNADRLDVHLPSGSTPLPLPSASFPFRYLLALVLLLIPALAFLWLRKHKPGILPPQTVLFNRFRIEDTLAITSLSHLYRCHDLQQPDHPTILKRILRPRGVNQPDYEQDFTTRLAAWEQLSVFTPQPPVVPLLFRGMDQQLLFWVAMPLLPGSTLRTFLDSRPGPRPRHQIEPILSAIAESIHFMHGHGLAHGDLKPENILLHHNRIPLAATLLDLGSTQPFHRQGLFTTATRLYMAPEQHLGQLLPQSDIFAFSLLAWELASGQSTRILLSQSQSHREEALLELLEANIPPASGLSPAALKIGLSFHVARRPLEIIPYLRSLFPD